LKKNASPTESIGLIEKKIEISQSFSRVEMSPISSPHSRARKVRRMILQRARLGQGGDELDFLGIIMPRLKEVKNDDAHSGAKNMSAKKDELYCVNLSNMLNCWHEMGRVL
jgi:hypothetical protein